MSITYGQTSGVYSTNNIRYDAMNVKSYIGSGTTIVDMMNTQNTILSGGASYTTFAGHQCFNVASEAYYTDTGNNIVILSNSYTYMSWCNIKAAAGTWRTLFRTQPNQHPILVQTDNTIGFYDNTGTNYNIFTGASAAPYIGTWAHWAVVGDGLTVKLYINGLQVGSSITVALQTATASGNYHRAWGSAGGSQSFGYIASMELLPNRALTLEEIQVKYNAAKAQYGL